MMDYPTLFATTITNVHPVSRMGLGRLFELCQVVEYPKNAAIIREGAADHHEYFLLDGIAYCGSRDAEDAPVAFMFYLPQQVILPRIARVSGGTSTLSVETLTPCTVAKIAATSFRDFQQASLEIREFSYKVLESELLKRIRRERSLLTQTAQARLAEFRREFGALENLVPHTAIASYLGITPVSLSRLRGARK